MLHPPVVRDTIKHRFQVVSGRQRLQIAQETQTACPCLVLPQNVPEAQAFAVLLEEILACRHLTAIEQAVLFQKTTDRLGKQQAADLLLPPMGLPPIPVHIDRALELLQLEEPLQKSLHRGQLDDSVARKMSRMESGDRKALFGVISLLKLSVGKQRQLTTVCQELSARHDQAIATLLESEDVQLIINHPEANPPQKAGNLMAWLARQYQPRLAEAEQSFHQFVAGLDLPANVSLHHAPAFEQDRLNLVITLPGRNELQKSWPQLRPILGNIKSR